jgi:DNA invertase Pin-like site-specific DNA recombinase
VTDQRRKRAIIYTRVSRDDTGEGQSNIRQEADCRAFAQLRGYEVVGLEADVSASAYSGKTRAAWERVLDRVRAREVDVVLAWKVDRLTRTVRELVNIIDICREHDVSPVTVDGDLDLSKPQGRAVATILGSISQMEVERKGERQKSANAQRRAAGQPWRSGWSSFGYDRDKNIVEEQAQMIREAAQDVLDGASLKSIARKWRDSGVTTPRSSKGAEGWTHNGVKTILLNPVNAGINTYKGEEIGKGQWDPIIDESTLRQLQAMLGDPSRRTYHGNGRRPENLLSGIARCARCDHPVVAGTSGGKKVYKCSNPLGDHLTTIRAEADEFVLHALTSADVFASHSVLPEAAKIEGQDSMLSDLAALDRREAFITEQFSLGLLQQESWTRAVAAIRAQRDEIQSRMAEVDGAERTHAAVSRARVTNFLNLSLADKRVTVAAIAEVQLHPRNRRRNVPVDEQVSVWAKSPRRLSPLIAGRHPESLRRRDEIVEARDAELLSGLENERDA